MPAVGRTPARVGALYPVPAECLRVYDLVRAGRLEEARGLHLRLLPVNRAVTAAFGIAARKAAMDMLSCHGGEPRMPLVPLAEGERDELGRIMREAGVLP